MIVLLLAACSGSGSGSSSVAAAPEPIAQAECGVCGMVVGEQPSPRGQVVYRDGSHAHVCSVEELRALAQQPSAKGRPTGVFVEVLPATFDVASTSTAPLTFLPASEAWYVFGAPRTGVMGEPVLVFEDEATAASYAAPLDSTPIPWTALEKTPFHAIPDEAGVNRKP